MGWLQLLGLLYFKDMETQILLCIRFDRQRELFWMQRQNYHISRLKVYVRLPTVKFVDLSRVLHILAAQRQWNTAWHKDHFTNVSAWYEHNQKVQSNNISGFPWWYSIMTWCLVCSIEKNLNYKENPGSHHTIIHLLKIISFSWMNS